MSAVAGLAAVVLLWIFKEQFNAAFEAVTPDTFEALASLTVVLGGFTAYWAFKLSRAVEHLQQQLEELRDQRIAPAGMYFDDDDDDT